MDNSFDLKFSAALLGFNGEATLYCQGISDTVAREYATEYAKTAPESRKRNGNPAALGFALVFSLSVSGSVRLPQAAPLTVVHALFDLSIPGGSPFPSNWFTVADQGNNTGLRVNLPFPDCAVRQSDCADLAVINTLDGFNADPRLSIPFDGPIDVATVTSDAVFLIRLSQASCGGDQSDDDACEGGIGDDGGQIIGVDQIVWEPQTNTLHVGSRQLLDQYTRYALIVTNGIRDTEGRPVEPADAFRRFRQSVRGSYRRALLDAIHAAQRGGSGANRFST